MSRNPLARRLRAAYSITLSNVFSGTVIVPAKRMCDDGGLTFPSGTYAITGATSALPSDAAILALRAFTRTLCLPSTMCGPLCSVPPIGISAIVASLRTRRALGRGELVDEDAVLRAGGVRGDGEGERNERSQREGGHDAMVGDRACTSA